MFVLVRNEIFKIFAYKKIYVFIFILTMFTLLPLLELETGAISFVINGQNLPLYMLGTFNSIIPIFIIVTLGDLITDEYINGTLKLPLLHPVPRTKLLTAKFLALTVSVTILLLVSLIVSYVIGTALFGWGDQLQFNDVVLATKVGFLSTIGAYISSVLPLMAFAAVVMFICLHFASSGAAVATSIGLLLGLSVAGQIVADLRPYLVITYFSEFPNTLFFTGSSSKIIQALVTMMIYGVSFYLSSILTFKKKDLLY